MKGKVKKKITEKLTDANIKHVIGLLEGSPPITKKEACEILHISYNTTRLNKIIEEFKEDQERIVKRKAEKRGKPADKGEIAIIVESYLEGDSISDIAKRVYRNPAFVKALVERIGVPIRVTGDEKHGVVFLPEACVAEDFEVGEIAWAANYHAPCEIRQVLEEKYINIYGSKCYRVWIREQSTGESLYFGHIDGAGFNAFIPAYDLGKLSHLQDYGVNVERL